MVRGSPALAAPRKTAVSAGPTDTHACTDVTISSITANKAHLILRLILAPAYLAYLPIRLAFASTCPFILSRSWSAVVVWSSIHIMLRAYRSK